MENVRYGYAVAMDAYVLGGRNCGFGTLRGLVVRRRAAKRLGQQPVKPEFAPVTKDRQADGHAVMPRRRLAPIGPEQAIPPGQIEAEIAVGLRAHDGMVDAV